MLDILIALQKAAPIDFKIIAVNLDQKQPGFPEHILPAYFESLNIPYYIVDKDTYSINGNLVGAIITPDKDIIPNAENLEPAYIVFENYEKILEWNRSLRFALAVCTLKDKFENVL